MIKRFGLSLAVVALAGQATIGIPAAAQNAEVSARDAFYCEERGLGSWFYCDPEKMREQAMEEEAPEAPPPAPRLSAAKRLAAITEQLDELKAAAILDPTTESVSEYMRYQRVQLDRASTFADVWGRAVWQNPDLDYTLQRPINSLGKSTWMDERKAERADVMASLSQRYGLFYFYSSSCTACRVFSPIISSVSQQYGLEVLAVSLDGGPNDAFPNYVVDTGQYEKMGLKGAQVPALVLFDTHTKQPIPVGYGLMAADDIMQRIFYLTEIEAGSDY